MKRVYFLLSLVVLFSVFSCTKMKLNKLEGSWSLVPMSKEDLSTSVTWTFSDDNSLYIKTMASDSLDNVTTVLDTAVYHFNKQGSSYYIEISELGTSLIQGRHVVKKLTNSDLQIQHVTDLNGNDVFGLKEFKKL